MGEAVEKIHRAINRIDDPLKRTLLIARDPFLAIDGMIGIAPQKNPGDQLLRANIEIQLDVVRFEDIDVELLAKVFFQKGASGARGLHSSFEVVSHGKCDGSFKVSQGK